VTSNEKLKELYLSVNIDGPVREYYAKNTAQLTGPLYLKSNEEYEGAKNKVMIFGKKTNGWGNFKEREAVDVDKEMAGYDTFFNKGECEYRKKSKFFAAIKKLKDSLRDSGKNTTISVLWNNIVKMALQKKGFPRAIYKNVIMPNLNKIIVREIEILKPDYIIFLTGPDSTNGPYDQVINEVFGNPPRSKVRGFDERELCEITLPNVRKTWRTYHPGYLDRHKEKKAAIYRKIIEETGRSME
jgi:hypothetical protein